MQVEPERGNDDVPASGRSRSDRATAWAFVFVAGIVAAGIILRFSTHSDLWLDEAQTVAIARLPLRDLPAALRHDGAPPLYYVLLHLWMEVFGQGNLGARSLSGVIGAATLPLAYFSGVRLGGGDATRGRRIGWILVLLVATSPFAIRYSTEARMYALTIALVFLGYLAVRRALERPSLGRLTGVSMISAALLYAHYWSLFLLAVVSVIIGWRSFAAPAGPRAAERRMLGALALGAGLFVPWLPILSDQLDHTGTPWAGPTLSPSLVPSTLSQFAGGRSGEGRLLLFSFALLAAWGLVVRPHPEPVERVERVEPVEPVEVSAASARWEWLVGGATLLLGLSLSYFFGATYQVRYAAVVFPFVLMVVAFGVATVNGPRLRCAAVVVLVVLGLVGGVRVARAERTQARQVATKIDRGAHSGDVVAYCPDQVGPSVSRLVSRSARVHQYTFPGLRSPRVVDWVDYARRNEKAPPEVFVSALVNRVGNNAIWYVWSPGYATYDLKCERILTELRSARPSNRTLVVPDEGIFEHMGLVRFGD